VHIPIDASWEERYHHLNPEWDTHKYTITDYSPDLDKFIDRHGTELSRELRFWKPEKVKTLLDLASHGVDSPKL
jgi:hypothetical protein